MQNFPFTQQEIDELIKRAEAQSYPEEVLERLKWFADFAEHHSVHTTCRTFRIARSTFYRWLHRFHPDDLTTLLDHPTHATVRSLPNHQRIEPEYSEGRSLHSVCLMILALLTVGTICFVLTLVTYSITRPLRASVLEESATSIRIDMAHCTQQKDGKILNCTLPPSDD